MNFASDNAAGIRGNYLIVGIGDGSAQGILERGKSQPPSSNRPKATAKR